MAKRRLKFSASIFPDVTLGIEYKLGIIDEVVLKNSTCMIDDFHAEVQCVSHA